MKAYWELARPTDAIMAGMAALIGFFVSVGNVAINTNALLAAATVILITAGGQAINDYYDRNVDKKDKHKKKRPIPSGRVKPKNAFTFANTLFIAGLFTAVLINTAALLVALTFTILLALYSARLHKLKYLGNFAVSLGTMFTFVMGGLAWGNPWPALIIGLPAFTANMAREITKDLEDLKTDKGKKTTLPMILGEKTTIKIIAIYAIITALLGYAIMPYFSAAYAGFLLIGVAVLGHASALNINKKYAQAKKEFRYAMALILIGYIAGLII